MNISGETSLLNLIRFEISDRESMAVVGPANLQAPEVICIGEALVDRLGPLGGDPASNKNVEDCLGGAPANVACGLARLGNQVAFVGCLGADSIGMSFRNLMASRGVNLSGLQIDSNRPSRIVLVRRDLNGERTFQGFYGDKGNGFSDQALNLKDLINSWPLLVHKASWLLVGTIPLATSLSSEALKWSVEKALENGLKIAIDVNWRPTFWDDNFAPDAGPDDYALSVIQPLLESASLIKLAREEAIWFFKTQDPYGIARMLPKEPDVVITDGAKPVRWFLKGVIGETEALAPPSVIDTTGAGDAFTAGLLNQLLKVSSSKKSSETLHEIVRFAAACGALVCSNSGAIAPQPSSGQVHSFLASI